MGSWKNRRAELMGLSGQGVVRVHGEGFCLVCHSTRSVSKTMKSTKAPPRLIEGRLKICSFQANMLVKLCFWIVELLELVTSKGARQVVLNGDAVGSPSTCPRGRGI